MSGLQVAALYATVGVTGASQSVRDLNSVNSAVQKTQGTMSKLTGNAKQVVTGTTQVGQGLLRIGEWAALGAAAAAVASAKIATSFQQDTELIRTQAGASQGELDNMRRGIQAMVHEVGTTPDALAKGAYHIESVGLRGAQALDVLKASALGAKVGLADMESVTNALTAVTYSGIKGTKDAADAMAILDGIVGVGNMHLQDLTDSFKSGILGTAATFGVDLRSLGAAIATLTDAGVPANIAATRLNMTLSHMAAPVPKAIGVLKGLGISQFQLAKDLKGPDGIDAALLDLGKHFQSVGEMTKAGKFTPQGAADMTAIFGGSRFGTTAMQLITNVMAASGDRIAAKFDLITERSKTFGDNVKATMETAGFTFSQFSADLQNSAIDFANGFLPAVARTFKRFDAMLLAHRGDIMKLGVDLGAAIDRIDWNGVEKGVSTFVGWLKTGWDVISKIPPEIDLAVAGFLALNKVSGGLLGAGAGNIVGGLGKGIVNIGAGTVSTILSKLPGVGGKAASLLDSAADVTAARVHVTNWPTGFGSGMPGGGPTPPTEGGGSKLSALAPWLKLGGLGAFLATSVAGDTPLTDANSPLAAQIDDLQRSIDSMKGKDPNAVNQTFTDASGNTTNETNAQALARMQAQLAALKNPKGVTVGDLIPFADPLARALGPAFDGLTKYFADPAHQLALSAYQLTHAADALSGRAAARIKAMGGLEGVAARSAKAHGGHSLGPGAVNATFQRDIMRFANGIFNSTLPVPTKIANLERIAKEGDHKTRDAIKAEIKRLKDGIAPSIKRMAGDTASESRSIAAMSKASPPPTTVLLNIDGQELSHALLKWGPGYKI